MSIKTQLLSTTTTPQVQPPKRLPKKEANQLPPKQPPVKEEPKGKPRAKEAKEAKAKEAKDAKDAKEAKEAKVNHQPKKNHQNKR